MGLCLDEVGQYSTTLQWSTRKGVDQVKELNLHLSAATYLVDIITILVSRIKSESCFISTQDISVVQYIKIRYIRHRYKEHQVIDHISQNNTKIIRLLLRGATKMQTEYTTT
jgi:hypothetical protein